MVRRVEVDAVPAHGEEDLVAETVLAGVDVGEVDVLAFTVGGVAGDSTAVVEADEADSLVREAGRVVRAAVRITGDHAQALRESLGDLIGSLAIEEVVDVEGRGYSSRQMRSAG